MEQVFLLVNRLLAHKGLARENSLALRTYRVVPLQPLAGILEWVPNAIPIGDYLIPAHTRIFPTDIAPHTARALMKAEFERPSSTPHTKIGVFKEKILERFHPVFHHFFEETTRSPREWYANRLAFIKSTAVGAMTGYIVGLGDRHCQNIMIDNGTGEIIHIDLNTIFDVTKSQRVPERVPFRLTADFQAAMGPFGVDGPFLAYSEVVLGALRKRASLVLMIMEAFRYDPLHRWSRHQHAVPLGEAATPQSNKDADRALLRVREKLTGLEDGSVLSERGQAKFLVNLATNPDILAQMYYGWQAWM